MFNSVYETRLRRSLPDESSLIKVHILVKGLYLIYIFLSYFEIYFTGFVGNSTKYLMLALMVVLFYSYKGRLLGNRYWVSFLAWFAYWCTTLLWSSGVNNSMETYFVSIIGNLLFVIIVGGQVFDESFIRLNLHGHLFFSMLFGILSIFFHSAYIDEESFEARQVLTLFGQQNDPNNCAAFLLFGIAISAYCLVYERRHILFHLFVIAVNSYATLLTGSRAGLVGIGIIVLVLFFLPSQKRSFDLGVFFKKLIFIVIAGFVVYYFVTRFLPQASLERLLAFDEYQEGSGRTEKWSNALIYYRQKPFLGWGWGGFDFRKVGYADSAHNTYLTILCEGGLVGLILFLLPMLFLTVDSLRSKNVAVILLLICGLYPAFFIDAINKRFLWNAVILAILLVNYYRVTRRYVRVWKPKKEKE